MNYKRKVRGKEAKKDLEWLKQILSDNSIYRIEIKIEYDGGML